MIAASAADIHPYVEDLAKWPLWSPFDKEDPAIVIDLGTPSRGVGAKRSWRSEKMGNGSMEVLRSDPATGVAFTLTMEGGFEPFEVTFGYAPEPGGTRVTWTDHGDLGSNPIHRWFGVLMDGMVGGMFEKGLADLETVVVAKR